MLDGAPPAPTLALARDTGISSSDLITNDPSLSVSGLVPGAIVEYWSDYSTEWSTFFEPAGPLVTVMARQVVNGQPSPPSAFLSFDYDTIGPSPQVSAFSQSLFTPNSPSSDIVFTFFEEEVFGFTADDIVVTGGTISEFGASGLNYSAIFTAAPNFTGTGTVSMAANASFTDAAGNYGAVGGLLFFTFSIFDNLAPSITIESSAASLAEGETALITFTLTEPSASFDLSDVSFTGGALSNFSGTGAEYSAIFTPLPDFAGTGSISVAAGTFTDLSGNANASGDSDAAITINIDTVVVPPNNSPTGIALSSASIAENSPAGTAVGTLSTTDPDEGNTFTYTFVTGDGSTDNASFTIVGNQLQAAASLDFEAKGTYSVRVRSTDEGGLFVDRQFTIMVANVNERPLLDIAASPILRPVPSNQSTPVPGDIQGSTLVSELIGSTGTVNNFSDADGDLAGIAITGINLQGGRLWFTTNNGNSWREISEASDTKATLLYADNHTRLFFAPADGLNGTLTDVVTFRAWDRSGGFPNGATDAVTQLFFLPEDGAVETGGFADNVVISQDGRRAFAVDQQNGLVIFDISSPESPTKIGNYTVLGEYRSVAVSNDGHYAFFATGATGLHVIDVRDPARPTRVGGYNTYGYAHNVSLSADGRYAYVADGQAGLQILDVTNPATPQQIGRIDTDGWARSVVVSSNAAFAYVADWTDGLKIVDIRDPFQPVLVKSVATLGYVDGLSLSADNRHLFVAMDSAGIQVLDVNEPLAPVLAGRCDTVDIARRITLSPDNRFAVVADRFAGVAVVDVRSPSLPAVLGFWDSPGSAEGVAFSPDGRYVYLADGASGLRVIGISSDPSPFSTFSDVISVDVEEVNSHPTGVTLSASFFEENQPAGTIIGTFATTDPDTGDSFVYAFASGIGDSDNNSFQIAGNQLRTNAVFSHGDRDSYSVRVRSLDSGGLATEQVFLLTIRPLLDAIGTHVIDGRAWVGFAGIPEMSFAGPDFGGIGVLPEADLSVAETRPIPLSVTGLSRITVSASGQWGHQAGGETGPSGALETRDTSSVYTTFGISGLNDAPLNMLQGVFVDDTLFYERGLPPDAVSYDGQPVSNPSLFQTFPIGQFSADIMVPPGATRLYLGLHDGYEWSNNTGTVSVTISAGGHPASPESDFMFSNGTITHYMGPGGDVVIPSMIGGVPVTGIEGWAFSWRTNLTSIALPASLTSIGDGAFSGCTGLTSIVVASDNPAFQVIDGVLYDKAGTWLIRCPAGKQGEVTVLPTVTSIGAGAFSGCTNLTSITLPASLMSIGNSAFSSCSNLTSITLPASLTSIEGWAFAGCTSLTSITLPTSLTSIGNSAFSSCSSLTSIAVSSENASFQVVDGVLYDKAGSRLICCPAGKQGEVTVLPTVTSIGEGAFSGCSSLNNITLPESLTSIGEGAFSGCTSLTNITLPESLTSIGDGAFSSCTSLTSITLPASLTSVGGSVFSYCSSLTNIALPASLTSIGHMMFSGCTNLTSITLPASLTSIGQAAFSFCSSLTSIALPASLTSIGYGAFSGCTSLTSVTLPASLASIEGRAFAGCTSLTSITLPPSLMSIGYGAFSGCSNLITIALPASLTSIGDGAFSGCTGLTSIVVASDNPAFQVIDGVLYNKAGTWLIRCPAGKQGEVTVLPTVTSIGAGAFSGCTNLTSITLPASLTSIGDSAFSGCIGLTSIALPASLTSVGGGAFAGCTSLISVALPASLTSIGYEAFSGCTSLTSVTLPASLASIEGWAFAGCTSLTSITLPPSLMSIGYGAFSGCSSLTNITLPASLTSIGHMMFSGCTNLTSITLPASLTSIGNSAFSSCSSLTSITLPASLTSIGNSAFSSCSSLTSITLPASLTSIEGWAFAGCTSLTSITLPPSLMSIGYGAFSGCSNLTSIALPASLTSIGGGAFSGCSSLTNLTLPESLTSIGEGAFSGCTSLTNIVLPASLMIIGDGAFSGCTGLTGIALPASLTSIGDGAFSGCTGLTSIVVAPENSSFQMVDGVLYDTAGTRLICCPAGRQGELTVLPTVTVIGGGAFSGCTGLTGITLPASLTSIGDGAFSGCTGLTSISVASENPSFQAIDGVLYDKAGTRLICCPAGRQGEVTVLPTVTIIGNWAFSGCTGLTGITLPMSLTRIGDAAFSWCTSLASITLPVSLTSIGHGAFYNCTSLTSITLPASLMTIGGSAFSGCTGLTRVMFSGDAPTTLPDLFSGSDQVTVYYLPQTSGWSSMFEGRPTVAAVVPTGPTTPTAIGDDRRVTLTWSAPQSDGNNPITDYVIEYRESAGTDWTVFDDGESAANSTIVTGLTNGVGYVFRVAAKNAVGIGAPTEDSTVVVPQATARNVSISLGNGGHLFIDGQPVTYAGDPVTASFQSWTIFEAAVIRGQNLFFAQHSAGVIHRLYANSDWSLVGGLYGVGSAYSIYLPRSARGPEFPVKQEPEPLPSDFLFPVENSGVRLRVDPSGQLYADQTMLSRQESSVGVKLTDLAGYSPIAVMRENTDSTWRYTLLWRHRIDQSLIEWQFNADWVYQGTSRVPIESNAALELAYQVDINRDGSLA